MNKSDIAAKIKNAIEEKLCSLGAYVDKELPEYILVMIANKKSKDSMAKDLQLFLGQETNNFIEWLHDLLEKCQTNPEDAFRIKTDKPLKSKSTSSPDKKKKVDKDKQKVKSKSRKSDDKKDHKKGNLNKSNKNKSRSRSPKSEITPRSIEGKKSKITPEKIDTLPINKQSDIERKKEDVTALKIDPSQTYINEKSESVEVKLMPSFVPTVKVTERPHSKKEMFKSSIEMVQRDLKEAEADITNKTETVVEKQAHRSSVFTRLGTNDLRAKLNKNQDENQDKNPQLKRTIQAAQSGNEQDTRESKVKRLENHSPSPCFIVTLKGADKLNIPLISRLGPKRNQEMMDSIEDEMYDVEVNEVDGENCQETKENNDSAVENQLTRCRFWPSCKNKETCQYLHPTEPCKTFPSCKYGALCLYIHPNCKFSTNCTKQDCPYTHYGPRMITSVKSAGQTLSRCLYYPQCTNVNCKFFHPNLPCKFGLSCKQKDSCLYFHPSIPKMTELKWTANQEASNPTIVDSSKKAEIQTA